VSTLNVDKVDPSTGTALELGTSGDTINIPSGVTIANAGTATGFGAVLTGSTNNTVTTVTAANAISGETNLTFDGTDLTLGTGNVVMGTSGKGIDFSATADSGGTMTSELLDDYEEGTWSASIIGTGGSAGTWAQTGTAGGQYTKIGRAVFVALAHTAVSNKGSYSGSIKITGLPFTADGHYFLSPGSMPWADYTANIAPFAYDGTTEVKMNSDGYIDIAVPWSQLAAARQMAFSGTYNTTA